MSDVSLQVWCGLQAEMFSYVVGDYPEVEGRDDLSEVVIHLADINEDKKVTFQEFLDFSKVFREKAFTAVDTNKDGKVVGEEALNSATKASFSIVEKSFFELFALADLNKDGHLSTADLPMRKKEELDTNGDGSVSLKELLGHPIIFFPGPIQSVYKALDSNKDEIISKREAKNFINFLGKLFNVIDVDADCLVSLEEALTALDLAELPKVMMVMMLMMMMIKIIMIMIKIKIIKEIITFLSLKIMRMIMRMKKMIVIMKMMMLMMIMEMLKIIMMMMRMWMWIFPVCRTSSWPWTCFSSPTLPWPGM